MKKSLLVAALCATSLLASPASAALFVSGDTNILNNLAGKAPNQAFFNNIVEGTNVLVQDSQTGFSGLAAGLVTYYNGAGFSASLIGTNDALTAGNLAGIDLYVSAARSTAYSAAEIALLANFLGNGGNVLLTGDNAANVFTDLNANINSLLTALGSGMQIVPATLDGGGFFEANLLGPSPYLAGTDGFEYAATSEVTGGLALFGTNMSNTTFLAVEGSVMRAIPEPATWAFMIFGFGAIGTAMRRRKNVRVRVSYA